MPKVEHNTRAHYEVTGSGWKDAFDMLRRSEPTSGLLFRSPWVSADEPHDEDAVELALRAPGVDVNTRNKSGSTKPSVQCSY